MDKNILVYITNFIFNYYLRKYKIKYHEYYAIFKPYFKYSQKSGYVYEHRYIYHLYLSIKYNRIIYLPTKNYEINHINKNGFDNQISNLELITRDKHNKTHKLNSGKRICNICKSDKTRIKDKGIENWFIDINGFLCNICYEMIKRYKKKFGITKYI